MKTYSSIVFWLSFLVILGMVYPCSASGGNPGEDNRPNVIFIITDDQHRDQFNFLAEGRDDKGAALNLTPAIDRLAEEGVILDQFYVSTSVCTPSRYSVLTGTYASRARNAGFREDAARFNQANVHWNVDVIPGTPNIAQLLSANGYFTGGVGKNHVIAGEDPFKVPRDADPSDHEVRRMLEANQQAHVDAYLANGFDFAANIYRGNLPSSYPVALEDHNMDWIVKGALDFLDLASKGEEPFFLYFATTLEHGPDKLGTKYLGDPLVTPVGYLEEALQVMPSRESITRRIEESALAADRADVLWLDDGITALLDKLEEIGELNNSVIFFMNDHAVESGKGSLYQGGIHTAGFVWGPDFVNGGTRSGQLVSNIDLVPTVLDICDIDIPADYELDGKSFYSLLKGSDEPVHSSLFFEIGATRAVLMDGWKYIAFRTPQEKLPLLEVNGARPTHINDRPNGRGSEQPAIRFYPNYFEVDPLYNINDDPLERRNRYEEMKGSRLLETLQDELRRFLEEVPEGFGEFK
jgi:arylsulfatase A-like enzyme